MDQCAFIPRVCCHGGSLSPKPNEQIAWRFIRNDKVLWMRRVWLLHYPSITNDVLQINYQAATSSCWEADLVDESEKLPHGHPSMHGPLFSIQQSELVSVKRGGNSYPHDYFSGVVCAQRWRKRTNMQFVSRHGMESPSPRHKCWEVKRLTQCGFHEPVFQRTCSNSTWFHLHVGIIKQTAAEPAFCVCDVNVWWPSRVEDIYPEQCVILHFSSAEQTLFEYFSGKGISAISKLPHYT